MATWACIASEAASGSLRADRVGDRPVPGERGARAVGLRERLDPGLLDQVADLVHQPREQQRVGGRGDGAVEALVALHAAAAGLDVGLHRGERLVDAGEVLVGTTRGRQRRDLGLEGVAGVDDLGEPVGVGADRLDDAAACATG